MDEKQGAKETGTARGTRGVDNPNPAPCAATGSC
jgi:hypothetical protein